METQERAERRQERRKQEWRKVVVVENMVVAGGCLWMEKAKAQEAKLKLKGLALA